MNTPTRSRPRRRREPTAWLPFPVPAKSVPALVAIPSPVRPPQKATPPQPSRPPQPARPQRKPRQSVWTEPAPARSAEPVAPQPQRMETSFYLDLLGAGVVMGLVLLAVILV